MTVEMDLAVHYARPTLEKKIEAALKAVGKDLDHLTLEDLAPVDEFHVGGRQATIDLADGLLLQPGMTLLDIGCGLGGASRYFAKLRGCQVCAVDMTPDFVQVAESLAARVQLGDRVRYQQANALALPFEPQTFDRATLMHVGMNIADKSALFAEVRRVLRTKNARLGIYDIMRVGLGEIAYPVPWATVDRTSFVSTPEEYRRDLEAVGFAVVSERNRRDFGLEYFRRLKARSAEGDVSPLGLHIPMGETAVRQMVNIFTNIQREIVAPVEMICELKST